MFELGLGDGSAGRVRINGLSPLSVSPEGGVSPGAVSPSNIGPTTLTTPSAQAGFTMRASDDCGCDDPSHPSQVNATIVRATAAAMTLGLSKEHLQAAAAEVVGTEKAAAMRPEAAVMHAGIDRIASRLKVPAGAFLAAAKIPPAHARAAGLVQPRGRR